MRTNIDLQEDLLKEAGSYSQTTTKKDLVHEALATYVAVKKRESAMTSYKRKVNEIQALTKRIKTGVDCRDLLRADRERI